MIDAELETHLTERRGAAFAAAAAGDFALAARLADAARAAVLPYFRTPDLAVADKGGGGRFDPVTAADRAAETAMLALLRAERPDDAVLGEEFGEVAGASGRTWVLDPIDGTRAFLSGLLNWGVLIALREGGVARLGVVDQPFTGERFLGWRDGALRAAWTTRPGAAPRPLRTRACAELADAVLFATDPAIFAGEGEWTAFERVRGAVRLCRYGTDCYGYAMVAAGCADLVIEAGLEAYDVAAILPVIEGAGGVVTDWDGGPAENGGRVVAAGDARAHAAALALLAGR